MKEGDEAMTYSRSGASRLCRAMAFFLCLFLLSCISSPAIPEGTPGSLSVSVPKEVKGYSACTITVSAPAAGNAELLLHDSLGNPWLARTESLSAGENKLSWDGLGANRERLMSGPYQFDITLKADNGMEYSASVPFSVKGFAPALALALPSSDMLYLDHGENWFVECWVPSECAVVMEVRDAGNRVVYSCTASMKDPDRDIIRWDGTGKDRRQIAPGEYTVRLYAKANPDFDHVYPLTVAETSPEIPAVTVTGPVIPERGMSDEEIWEIMMRPSVVINETGSSRRFELKESPNARSASVGLACCATQALEILSMEDGWAQVRTGNYSNGTLVTGWFPANKLTVIVPAPHYGVLVDKAAQTLTLYQDGARICTIPVSTGLPTDRYPWRETTPGAFLTDVHFSPDFAQDGMRYEYPLRYQGGNIIHSTGFVRIPHAAYSVKDYSKNLPLLGQKASHGCVRISPFATADCPVNSYWLWTHLPYHTRVIILDD